MDYFKFLFTKRPKSAAAIIIAILLLTVGLPHLSGREVTWHTISEIEDARQRFGYGLLIVGFIVGMLLQVLNEFNRPK
jgi:Na+(H+)/acetate symporter ActP